MAKHSKFADVVFSIRRFRPVHHGVTLSLYYQATDGNQIEFQFDCCKTVSEAGTYRLSNACAARPDC